jgi:hypothetical protein
VVAYHFEKEALCDAHVGCEGCLHRRDVDGYDTAHDGRCADTADYLRRKEHQTSYGGQCACYDHAQRDSRVEQAATDTVQDPGGDEQTEAVAERDKDDGLVAVAASWGEI